MSIIDIAAGYKHSLALTTSNRVYSWGSGESGRLGQGDYEAHFKPTLIKF